MTDTLIVIQAPSAELGKSDLSSVGFGLELTSAGGGQLDILLLGPGAQARADSAAALGARQVYAMAGAELEVYTAEAYAAATASFLQGRSYRCIGAATNSATREFFPRLAAILDAPMASDVLGLESLDPDRAVFTRAVFVGNLLATVELAAPTALGTCRASEFSPPPAAGASPPSLPAVARSEERVRGGEEYAALAAALPVVLALTLL